MNGGAGADGEPWLVVIDMQAIFGDPSSQWAAPRYAEIVPAIQSLVEKFGERVIFTKFIAPDAPAGAWRAYYRDWPFALDPASKPLYELSGFDPGEHTVIERETFGKWDAGLDAAMNGSREMVLVGVSTDCCVISTALAAADAGVHIRVVSDACAGVSDADHDRALAVMALYGPLIEVTTTGAVLEATGQNPQQHL